MTQISVKTVKGRTMVTRYLDGAVTIAHPGGKTTDYPAGQAADAAWLRWSRAHELQNSEGSYDE